MTHMLQITLMVVSLFFVSCNNEQKDVTENDVLEYLNSKTVDLKIVINESSNDKIVKNLKSANRLSFDDIDFIYLTVKMNSKTLLENQAFDSNNSIWSIEISDLPILQPLRFIAVAFDSN